jgi:pimeloyl-ACP methyl ester carboxylesterase
MRYRRLGAGQPVVLVHTLRTQLEYFRALINAIDRTRYDVIALDLPGHGEWTAPRVDYTADYFSDAVEALLEHCALHDVVLVGGSIGGSIALILAARGNPRLERVVALNPYDYGRWGGIRRSSPLNNVIFTTMLWPGAGALKPYVATRRMLSPVMAGGLHDRKNLPPELVDAMHPLRPTAWPPAGVPLCEQAMAQLDRGAQHVPEHRTARDPRLRAGRLVGSGRA